MFPQQIQDIARKTDGLLLRLALAVDMVTKSVNSDVRVVSQTISAKILKEVTALSLHPLLEVLIIMEYASFTQRMHHFRTGNLLASHVPLLHELLGDWCSYSVDKEHNQNYHEFPDFIIQHDPDSIAILRDFHYKPIGMFLIQLYTTKTAPLLLKHFQPELYATFTVEGCRQAALQADTYIPILVTAIDDLTAYTSEELVGMLIVEQLVKLEAGKRAILQATNDLLKQFLRTNGFASRPVGDASCNTS